MHKFFIPIQNSNAQYEYFREDIVNLNQQQQQAWGRKAEVPSKTMPYHQEIQVQRIQVSWK